MMQNIFNDCWAKTNAIEVKHDNKFRPCCVFKGKSVQFDRSIDNTLSKFHTLDDKQVASACSYCIDKSKVEPVGRKVLLDRYKQQGYEFFYDLQLSNVCNLACTMCNSEYSSKWVKLGQQLNKDYLIGFNKTSNTTWNKDIANKVVTDINNKSMLGNVVVSIKGGEPTVQPEVIEFFNALKHKHHVHLHIVTNLQRWPVWFDTMLHKFKSVKITVSIEGIEETYEYSRVYGSWKSFDTNVKQLESAAKQSNISWSFGPLITAHTVGDTSRTFNYIKQYRYGDISNFVYSPIYVNPTILPDAITHAIVEDMHEQFDLLKQSMINTKHNKQQFENFIDYTKQLDKTLNTQFIDTPTGKYFKHYFK